MVVGYIPFEITLPISYFLMLKLQAIGCLLKDIRFCTNGLLLFLHNCIKSQISTVTFLGGDGAYSMGLIVNL